jgi:hypothetical protein
MTAELIRHHMLSSNATIIRCNGKRYKSWRLAGYSRAFVLVSQVKPIICGSENIIIMNWRALLGLALLLAGMAQMYVLIANRNNIKPGETPVYAIAGCVVWMAAGVFLIIKGMSKKEN